MGMFTKIRGGMNRYAKKAITEIETALGLPAILGQWYFVDPTNGSALSNGKSPNAALDSIETAYGKCTSGAGDGICVFSAGTTSAGTTSYLTDTITWSKHGITVYGVAAPTFYNMRARVSTAETDLTALIIVSGANNVFYNISFYNGTAITSAEFCAVQVTGIRNAFINCDFKAGSTTASAYKTDLWLASADENLFSHCNFGNASYNAGNNAAAHIYISGTDGNGQNMFEDCTTIAQVSTGTAFGVLKCGAATALNGTIIFKNCLFNVWQANTGLTAMASWFIGTKPTTGNIVLDPLCMSNGYAAWDATGGNDRVVIPLGVTDGDVDPNIGGCP